MHRLIYLPPPVLALLLLGLGFWLDREVPGLPGPSLPAIGILLIAEGLVLAVIALLELQRQRTTFIPHGDPSALVVTGAYQWTRNPIYLGILVTLFGLGLYSGALFLFAAPIVFFSLINKIHIPYEEDKLAERFGSRYWQYERDTSRWL